MKKILICALFLTFLGWSFGAWPLGNSSDREAYEQAKPLSIEKYRTHVLSIYGKGTDKDVQTWYVTFYDPDSPSKGKAVVVQNGKAVRSYAAESRKAHNDNLSFDPTLSKVAVETALKTAKAYADNNQVLYNGTTVLLRRLDEGKAPAWRVELLQDGSSKGFIFVKAEDGSLINYAPPLKPEDKVQGFGKDVEDTFRDIGADLEEFFTGERTVDKP